MGLNRVQKAVKVGQIFINVPVITIMFGFPILIWILIGSTTGLMIKTIAVLTSFVVGIGLGWLWWSVFITKWRLWAFSYVNKNDWIKLKKKAVEKSLTWEDGHKFERTEFRNKIQKQNLSAIAKEIVNLERLEYNRFHLTVPNEISYKCTEKAITLDLIGYSVLILLGIITIFTKFWLLGILLILMYGYKLFTVLNSVYFNFKGDALIINDKEVNFKIHEILYNWESIEFLNIDENAKKLTVYLYEEIQEDGISFDLNYINIPEYDKFKAAVEIISNRFKSRKQT